ncbi:hypothetical protein [Kouleothrix sp.]|uniref:hypothetical protein n=1 Tax=Kouleothrix sp. TaxID=2779161 RepID=UPI00391AD4DB
MAIAAVMVSRPEVLVLDEATSELDALMVGKIFALCERLNRELGTTIVLVSHELELLARHAHRLVLLHAGQVLLDAPPRAAAPRAVRAGGRAPTAGRPAGAVEPGAGLAAAPADRGRSDAGAGGGAGNCLPATPRPSRHPQARRRRRASRSSGSTP